MQFIVAYIAAAIVFLGIDYVWLAHVARGFFIARIGDLLLDRPNLAAAAGFYLIYVAGIVIFAVAPALKVASPASAALYGALFGFFAYATYDMTNYATLKGWPLSIVLLDVTWGTLLTGTAAVAGYYAARGFAG